jgi:DNA helicase-2/ATP-dependent DNA helicase PcrA
MEAALKAVGLKVYAPRAGRFLEVPEAVDVLGCFAQIFGRPDQGDFSGGDWGQFHTWLDSIETRATNLMDDDPRLAAYVKVMRTELERIQSDFAALLKVVAKYSWDLAKPYDIALMKRPLSEARGLSRPTQRNLGTARFDGIVTDRAAAGRPFTLAYVINRASSLDWSVLDLFYRLCGFKHFKAMFDLAENGKDEGPICNLSLLSQYLGQYMDQFGTVITAERLVDGRFLRGFFTMFLYALFRLGESEYEDEEDPFPKGRIPFITIHQAKGLEFPVVVIPYPMLRHRGPSEVEKIVRNLLSGDREPLDRIFDFDAMRLYYVALSRAKHLLVLGRTKGQGISMYPRMKTLLDSKIMAVPDYQPTLMPPLDAKPPDLPGIYSYTADYLLYERCPRQYMIFRKYNFTPSRSQTMFFGSLVHRTMDDLHQFLIARRPQP